MALPLARCRAGGSPPRLYLQRATQRQHIQQRALSSARPSPPNCGGAAVGLAGAADGLLGRARNRVAAAARLPRRCFCATTRAVRPLTPAKPTRPTWGDHKLTARMSCGLQGAARGDRIATRARSVMQAHRPPHLPLFTSAAARCTGQPTRVPTRFAGSPVRGSTPPR